MMSAWKEYNRTVTLVIVVLRALLSLVRYLPADFDHFGMKKGPCYTGVGRRNESCRHKCLLLGALNGYYYRYFASVATCGDVATTCPPHSREAEKVFFIFRVHRVIIFGSGINRKVKVWGACLGRM